MEISTTIYQKTPYEYLVKYTQQRYWIEGHGFLVALAMFLGGLSGGLYLASLYFDSLLGMFIAWLLAMAAGITDMAHLGQPKQFWRMMLKPRSSWISRGFILIFLFLGTALIQLAISQWAPGNAWEIVFKVIAGIMAFGVAIYSGFVVGYVGAIKMWSSGLIPVLYVISGLTNGLALIILVILNQNAENLITAVNLLLIALVVYVILLGVYLWSATYIGAAARDSVIRVLRGNIAPIFWLGTVFVGIIIPAAMIAPFSLSNETSKALFAFASVCTIIGGLSLRYVILKGGIYIPLTRGE
jgi:formate-dependent nitrite reductase membrane component NrfD